METKANYVLVGVFTVVILALSFGFVYWSARLSDGSQVPLIVRIDGSVTGLGQGSQVLFNGLKVGDVRRLRIDPNNPRVVIADTMVDNNIPITPSTRATLGFQGLTGIAFLELKGGNVNERNIIQAAREEGAVPVITADPSDVTDLLATAKDIAGRADRILSQFETLVADVRPAVQTTASNVAATSRNVEIFTASLAENAEGVDRFLESVSRLAVTANTVAEALPGAITSVQAVVEAVDPQSVRATLDNVAAITGSFREQTAAVAGMVDDVRTATQSFAAVGESVTANAPGIDRFLSNLGPISESAATAAGKLDTTLGSANAILAAVDPQQVQTAIGGLATAAAAIGSQSEAIQAAITGASNAAGNIERVTASIAANSGAIDSFMENLVPASENARLAAAQLNNTLVVARNVVGAIDPVRLAETIDSIAGAATNVSEVAAGIGAQREAIEAGIAGAANAARNIDRITTTVAENTEAIDAFVTGLGPLATSADQALTQLNATLGDARNVVAAVDPAQVSAAIEGISSAATSVSGVASSIGEQREEIRAAITGASNTAQNLDRLTASLAENSESIDSFIASLGPISQNVGAATARLDTALESATRLVSSVDPAKVSATVDSVSALTAGLEAKTAEIQSIIDNVDATVQTLNGTLAGFDGTRSRVDQILAGIDAEAVGTAVNNVSSATDNVAKAADSVASLAADIGERREDINAIITNVQETSAKLNAASGRVDTVLASIDGFLSGGEAGGLSQDVRATLLAFRQAAEGLQARIDPIADNLENFSGSGLREVQGLVRDVSRAVGRIEGAVTDISDNPSRILYGGEEVKQYEGRTRR